MAKKRPPNKGVRKSILELEEALSRDQSGLIPDVIVQPKLTAADQAPSQIPDQIYIDTQTHHYRVPTEPTMSTTITPDAVIGHAPLLPENWEDLKKAVAHIPDVIELSNIQLEQTLAQTPTVLTSPTLSFHQPAKSKKQVPCQVPFEQCLDKLGQLAHVTITVTEHKENKPTTARLCLTEQDQYHTAQIHLTEGKRGKASIEITASKEFIDKALKLVSQAIKPAEQKQPHKRSSKK